MKNIKQQIENLRHWANMAELTSEQVSCLAPIQLREVACSLEELNADAQKIRVYEKIYGPLRTCPGDSSVYPVGQHSHGCMTFYCLEGHHHIGEYMFGPGNINSHTHSFTGGKNDA